MNLKGELPPPNSEFKEQVQEIFDKKGIVWVTNTGAESLQDLKEHVDLVMDTTMEYKGGANSRG